jgi:hypothetical protein
MTRLALFLTFALALAAPGQAAPKHWYTDGRWWAGTAVIVGSNILDVQSSCRAYGMGYHEQGSLLRGTRSCGKVAAVGMSFTGLYIGLHALAWHCQQSSFHPFTCYGANQYDGNHPKLWGAMVYGTIPAIQAGVHLNAAIGNYRLKPMDSAGILAH